MKLIGTYDWSKAWFIPALRLIRKLDKMGLKVEPEHKEHVYRFLPQVTCEWVVYRKGRPSSRMKKDSLFGLPYFMQSMEDKKIENLEPVAESYAHVIKKPKWLWSV